MSRSNYRHGLIHSSQTYDDTQQQTYGTIQQQAYDDSQQTWTDQQIVPTTEDIPVVPVINNTQERTMDLYNTDQCIHTYNVVNTVEGSRDLVYPTN